MYNFLRGLARLLWPFPPDERVDSILQRSDAEALRSDWEAVGQDMWAAVAEFENEITNGE